MTNDQMQSMRDDIAFMKELAEDGQTSSSRVGGAILACAGVIYAVAAVVQWGLSSGRLPLSTNYSPFVWIGATVLFLIAMAIVKAANRSAANRGPVNRANRSVWVGAGWAIAALSLGFFAAAYMTGFWPFMNLLAPVVLAIYGAAWFVNGAMTKRRLFTAIAAGCFVGAVGMCALVNRAEIMLAYAAALMLFAGLPGLILMRRGAGAS